MGVVVETSAATTVFELTSSNFLPETTAGSDPDDSDEREVVNARFDEALALDVVPSSSSIVGNDASPVASEDEDNDDDLPPQFF